MHRYNFVELLTVFPSYQQAVPKLSMTCLPQMWPSKSHLLPYCSTPPFSFRCFPTREILVCRPPPPNTSSLPTTSFFSSPLAPKVPFPTERAANTFACCSYFPLWTRNPSPGCKPPQCSALADRRSRQWHRAVRSPPLPQLGSGLSSSAGTSPSGWQWDQRLPPHSASHLHKNLLLKLKEGDLMKHRSSKLA